MAVQDTPDLLSTYFIMPKIDICGLRYPLAIYKDGTFELGCLKHDISWFETTERDHEELAELSDNTLDWFYRNKTFLIDMAKGLIAQMAEFENYPDDQQNDFQIIADNQKVMRNFNINERPKVDI